MEQFDYIIIGAGSAGCILANRLSANPANSVLILEAGGKDKDSNIKVPAAFSKLFHSASDWDYQTIPQTSMNQREMYQPRGKVLGGCSSINAMIYIRGHAHDYDTWASLGNPGWSFQDLLPYFKRSEQNHSIKDEYHGSEGELHVNDQRSPHPLSQLFVEAAGAAGYTINKDFNGEQQEGVGLYQVNQHRGKRWSAADAFLKPALSRPNLKLKSNALVSKVLIEQKKATGIRFSQNGQSFEVKANKEVILCAGAFNSPQILALSGIGDASELQPLGISVEQNLPGVGKGLKDHMVAGMAFTTKYPHTLDSSGRFPGILGSLFQFLTKGSGPLTSIVAEAGGFVKSDPALPAPDLQFNFAPSYFIRHGFDNPKTGKGLSAGITLIQPFSTGTVKLQSNRPEAPVLIDPQYFSDERDVQVFLKGMRMVEEVIAYPKLRAHFHSPYLPDKEELSDQEMIDLLKTYAQTLYHPTSTCRMGNDDMAVVDSELRVHGISNLRVADASIMPTIVRGNTNAPTYMIAEKASDLILKCTDMST